MTTLYKGFTVIKVNFRPCFILFVCFLPGSCLARILTIESAPY